LAPKTFHVLRFCFTAAQATLCAVSSLDSLPLRSFGSLYCSHALSKLLNKFSGHALVNYSLPGLVNLPNFYMAHNHFQPILGYL